MNEKRPSVWNSRIVACAACGMPTVRANGICGNCQYAMNPILTNLQCPKCGDTWVRMAGMMKCKNCKVMGRYVPRVGDTSAPAPTHCTICGNPQPGEDCVVSLRAQLAAVRS